MVCRDVESSRSDAGRAGEPSLPALTAPERMEENARETAQRDGISEGLVCVYGAMETCRTFRVQYHKNGPKVRPDRRVCLVIYFYWMDREFGLMHVKLQTWFPFTVQVYVNGHEWLARKLAARGIAFEKFDNAFVELADAEKASEWRGDSGGAIGPRCSIAWPAGSIPCFGTGWPASSITG